MKICETYFCNNVNKIRKRDTLLRILFNNCLDFRRFDDSYKYKFKHKTRSCRNRILERARYIIRTVDCIKNSQHLLSGTITLTSRSYLKRDEIELWNEEAIDELYQLYFDKLLLLHRTIIREYNDTNLIML
jgi:hypothetical protein